MTIVSVVIACANGHSAIPIAEFHRGNKQDPLGWWRFDDMAAAGGGKKDDGLRDYYDPISQNRHVTRICTVERNGEIISETLEFICPRCGSLRSIRFDKCVRACERIASSENSSVSFAEFCKVASKVG